MGLYKNNKKAKVGELIECPVCHKKFKKRQYSQAFCCTKCKDKFHNQIDGDRHEYYTDRDDDNIDYDDRDEIADGLHM